MSDDSKVSDLESQISGLQESSATKEELAQVEQSISRFSDLLDKTPTKDDVDKLQQKVDAESKLADARYSTSGSASDTDKLSQIEFDLSQVRQELNVAKKQLADLWPIKPTEQETPSQVGSVFKVVLSVTSATSANTGTKTTAVAFQYDVSSIDGVALAVSKSPEWPSRSENGKKTAATGGIAYYNTSNILQIAIAFEQSGTGGCP